MITLNLTDRATNDYAAFYGWTSDSEQTADNFVKDKLLEKITNDLIEKRNRDAIEAVQDQLVTITEAN